MPEKYKGDADGLKAYYFPNLSAAPVFSTGPLRRGRWGQASVNTPGFFKLSKAQKAALPWHAYSYEFEEWLFGAGSASGKNGPTLEVTFVGQAFAPSGFLTTSFSAYGNYNAWPDLGTKAKALGKLQSKIAQNSMNVAQSIAERKQTVSLIGDSVRRLVQLALWIRKGDFKNIHQRYGLPKPRKTRTGAYVVPQYYREVTKVVVYGDNGQPLLNRKGEPKKRVSVIYRDKKRDGSWYFSDIWLEYQYGWKPLLADIYGSAEVLSKLHESPRPLRFTAMSSGNQKLNRPFATWAVNGSTYRTKLDLLYADSCRYVLEIEEDISGLKGLAEAGLTNPLLLAWEVIPYSFVADWFIPLGNYLQQLEYARGCSFKRGSVRWKRSAVGEVFHELIAVTEGYRRGSVKDLDIDIRWRKDTREILGSFPYQELPRFSPKLGVERVLSGIALFNQIFARGKPTVRI